MCVLTYVPVNDGGFIITSNRDEHIKRQKALPPKKIKINGQELYCPIDPVSNGTWIATTKNFTLVLLNGGNKKHETKESYRQSRGRVILEFTQWSSPKDFYEHFDFNGMEPFTLVVFNHKNRNEIFEIKWCDDQKHQTNLNGREALIWSSATLYDENAVALRKDWFFQFLDEKKEQISSTILLDFHKNGGKHDLENSIKLKRPNGIETVCITQVEVNFPSKNIYFYDVEKQTGNRYLIY
jgi:hypothetical protein